ncbi:hypothetical protein V3851_09970 [Paenibacillus sp. M1]|uniref:Uncharacterized protein n=1 Tax=Paenibacillus haidiansis TaxID=1574488 RepID=A0ABU7VQV2_9BACL
MSTDKQQDLTNDPQEMLKAKHEADKEKQQFTSFARSVSGQTPFDQGQVTPDKHHEPDQQNHMKDTENRMI